MTPPLTSLPQWSALEAHATTARSLHLRDLFAGDPNRFASFSVNDVNLLMDFSRQRVTSETLKLLVDLARARGLRERIDAMFSGEKINTTENRAVLHTALRNKSGTPVMVDGQDVMPEVMASLEKMRTFVEGVHNGRVVGATG